MTNKDIELSVVASIYDDAELIIPLVEKTTKVLVAMGVSFEIILVNDKSRDYSERIIEEQCRKHSFVRALTLSRNFGQQIAISAGVHYARGRYVLIMDGDLQNPIDAIPKLYGKIKEGFGIVYAISTVRNSFSEKITSKIFWLIINKWFRANILPHQLMMRIMTAECAETYNSYTEITRTVAGVMADMGFSSTILEVQNQRRTHGKSHYNFIKRFNLFIDAVLSLTNNPLNILIYFGSTMLVLTLGFALYVVSTHFGGEPIPGYWFAAMVVSFFGSIIIVILGILARYLANIYTEVRRRPLFLVQRKFNF
ncbi:MAG: glycosyltransferase family 2 protein [Oligoflexia bacterium]|nr:glycosyltransferase family 2 protein [Oligoflexia bacterium]